MKTIIAIELEIEVDFFPNAGEPEVPFFSNGTGQPGFPPTIEIDSITLSNGVDVTKVDFPKETREAIEKACWEALEDDVL